MLEQEDSSAIHVAVQWPPYDVNRQQYLVIGKLRWLCRLRTHKCAYVDLQSE